MPLEHWLKYPLFMLGNPNTLLIHQDTAELTVSLKGFQNLKNVFLLPILSIFKHL